jgi:hypothetical protein
MCDGMFRATILGLALLCMLASPPSVRAGDNALTVVELFTSQGCSSCPPADEMLGELAAQPDIQALSFHVDYWDYIGWKDLFALPGNTERQRSYAKRFGRSYVYTPQMVIDGAVESTGRNARDVLRMIESAKSTQRVPVSLGAAADGGMKVMLGSRRLLMWQMSGWCSLTMRYPRRLRGVKTMVAICVTAMLSVE